MLVYLKALQYSMSESDHLNSTNNTGNTFISLDQASTIMADQTQGANPQQQPSLLDTKKKEIKNNFSQSHVLHL